jgi:hypothetical protein
MFNLSPASIEASSINYATNALKFTAKGSILDTMQDRLDRNPGKMKQRRRTVEHVFGTLKFWMGSAHFR